jgi:hypothetical protein
MDPQVSQMTIVYEILEIRMPVNNKSRKLNEIPASLVFVASPMQDK